MLKDGRGGLSLNTEARTRDYFSRMGWGCVCQRVVCKDQVSFHEWGRGGGQKVVRKDQGHFSLDGGGGTKGH